MSCTPEDLACRRRMPQQPMPKLLEMPVRNGRAVRTDAAPDRVIVVLGYHQIGEQGEHGISPICRAAIRRAEALAAEAPPRAVIFTGWSSNGGPAEADQMAEEWKGPRRRPDPRAASRQHGRERRSLAGHRASDRGGLRSRARVLDPALSTRPLLLRTALPQLRLRDSLSLRLLAAAIAAAAAPRAVVDHPHGARQAPGAATAGRGRLELSRPRRSRPQPPRGYAAPLGRRR